ncbi:ADP-ribosyltransferase [Aliivibrio sp. S10_S31]|uniref:ADP-ribosyltransferase n=1 Tax=Aliivibrio sp. S10_S31 TaxID=2720224 RepID=UPI0016814050|nr:ADP-ribosyltransferase [Aliivibrio sp. S10_S31]MBD1569774.1 NAD(+)--arginine ADP-ribosyltransferase [Aliivibrio sp. S10_S31]
MHKYIILILWGWTALTFASSFEVFKQPFRSQEAITALSEGFKDWSKSNTSWKSKLLSNAEVEALEDFSISGYRTANQYLHAAETKSWGSSGKEIKGFVRTLKSGLNKMPEYHGTTYRGTWSNKAMIEQLEVGDILYESGFLSTSVIPEVARRFAVVPPNTGNRTVKALFHIETNRRSFSIASISDYSSEAEVVISPNSYFKVTGIERGALNNYISLETVSPRTVSMGNYRLFNLYSGEQIPHFRWQQMFCR